MRYAVVKGNLVINTILLDSPEEYQTEDLLIASDTANIGDSWDGQTFSPPPIISTPNWDTFNRGMLVDVGYNRVSDTSTNRSAVRRLEALAISLGVNQSQGDFEIFIMLWNLMIDGAVLKPSTEEISGWGAIATSASMPFSFGSNGKLSLI